MTGRKLYLEWKRISKFPLTYIISSLLKMGNFFPFRCILNKFVTFMKLRSWWIMSVFPFNKTSMNSAFVFLKTCSCVHVSSQSCDSECWLCLPLVKELASYLEKAVQVGAHIYTHARETFLFLAQTVLFLDLSVFEWEKSFLINFTNLSAEAAWERLLLVLCVYTKE